MWGSLCDARPDQFHGLVNTGVHSEALGVLCEDNPPDGLGHPVETARQGQNACSFLLRFQIEASHMAWQCKP